MELVSELAEADREMCQAESANLDKHNSLNSLKKTITIVKNRQRLIFCSLVIVLLLMQLILKFLNIGGTET